MKFSWGSKKGAKQKQRIFLFDLVQSYTFPHGLALIWQTNPILVNQTPKIIESYVFRLFADAFLSYSYVLHVNAFLESCYPNRPMAYLVIVFETLGFFYCLLCMQFHQKITICLTSWKYPSSAWKMWQTHSRG
jgi:hypothetical protein